MGPLDTYLVCWSGGYEPAEFFASHDEVAAKQTFKNWADEMDEDENYLQLICISYDGTIRHLATRP